MERELCAAVVAQDVDAFVGLCEREEACRTIVYAVRTWPVDAVAQLMALLGAAWPALQCRPAPIFMTAQYYPYAKWDAIPREFLRDWQPSSSVADVYASALCDALLMLPVYTRDDHNVRTDDGSAQDALLHMWACKVALLLEYVPIIECDSNTAWLVFDVLTTELDKHAFASPAAAAETARVIGHMTGALHEAFTLEEKVSSAIRYIQYSLYLWRAMVGVVRVEGDTPVHAAFVAAVLQHPMFVCYWCRTSQWSSPHVGFDDDDDDDDDIHDAGAARRADIVRYTALLPTLCGRVRDGAWQRRVDAAAAWRRMRSLV